MVDCYMRTISNEIIQRLFILQLFLPLLHCCCLFVVQDYALEVEFVSYGCCGLFHVSPLSLVSSHHAYQSIYAVHNIVDCVCQRYLRWRLIVVYSYCIVAVYPTPLSLSPSLSLSLPLSLIRGTVTCSMPAQQHYLSTQLTTVHCIYLPT